MGTTRLKAVPSPISDERQRLALAISKRVALRQRLAAVKDAAHNAMLESMSLRRELDTALGIGLGIGGHDFKKVNPSRVEIAQELASKNALEKAMQRPPIAGETISEAKMAIASLEDQYESLNGAQENLQQQQRQIERQIESASSEVDAAVSKVLWDAPEVRRLLSDLQTAWRTHLELMATIREIGSPPNFLRSYVEGIPDPSDELPAKWRAAIQNLKESAEVELPG